MASSELAGAQMRSDGSHRCDLEYCQRCGHAFTTALEGYWVGPEDIGPDAEGGTAYAFRTDVEEQLGREWLGFKEEDIGAWCDSCSWIIQRKRSSDGRFTRGEDMRKEADR